MSYEIIWTEPKRVCRQGGRRIVGKKVRFEDGDIGTVTFYDSYEKEFIVELENHIPVNKRDNGIVHATIDEFVEVF